LIKNLLHVENVYVKNPQLFKPEHIWNIVWCVAWFIYF